MRRRKELRDLNIKNGSLKDRRIEGRKEISPIEENLSKLEIFMEKIEVDVSLTMLFRRKSMLDFYRNKSFLS